MQDRIVQITSASQGGYRLVVYGLGESGDIYVLTADNIWRLITRSPTLEAKPRVSANRKLDEDQVRHICRLVNEEGRTCRAVAEMFGVSFMTINRIVNDQTYKDLFK